MNTTKRTKIPLLKMKMIARCYRCWGSKESKDMFRCLCCQRLFCKTHQGLPGLLLCIECFEKDQEVHMVIMGVKKDDK